MTPLAHARLASAPAVVGLVDQLPQRALEVLEVEVEVDDLIDADRLSGGDRFLDRLRGRGLDFLNGPARDREHHDESDLALGAGHLEVETLFLVTQDLDVTTLQAASAHRPVVEPRAVADEVDDAHAP